MQSRMWRRHKWNPQLSWPVTSITLHLFSLQDWEDTPKSQKVGRDATAPWIHCNDWDLFILKQHLNEKRIMCVMGMCIFLTIWILRVNLRYVSQVRTLSSVRQPYWHISQPTILRSSSSSHQLRTIWSLSGAVFRHSV